MSEKLLKNTRFRSEVKDFFSENKKTLLDIVLFGSSLKGKDKPEDIDILVIHKDRKDIDLSYKLKKKVKALGYDIEITDKTYKELFEGSFKAREAILSEGYSLVYDHFLSAGLGYMNLWLVKYELRGLGKSDRMRFYYSLYGRGKRSKGMLEELDLIKFSESVLLCPVRSLEKTKEYLTAWNIGFTDFPILIPERLKAIFR